GLIIGVDANVAEVIAEPGLKKGPSVRGERLAAADVLKKAVGWRWTRHPGRGRLLWWRRHAHHPGGCLIRLTLGAILGLGGWKVWSDGAGPNKIQPCRG